MADTPSPLKRTTESGTPPSSAAEQTRLRKERREAKIKAGGSARLNKITGLGGGVQRDPPFGPISTVTSNAADPEEVDISNHYYEPTTISRSRTQRQQPSNDGVQLTDEQIRSMMFGFPPNAPDAATSPQPGFRPFDAFSGITPGIGAPNTTDDPILKLLQQVMGAAGATTGSGPAGMPAFPGMPPSMGGSMPGQAPASTEVDPYAYIWRITHAMFALALGLYIALTAEFTGTKLDRDLSLVSRSATGAAGPEIGQQSSVRFFYIFAAAEIVLQTSRFFLEKGAVQTGGILGMVMGFLPQPWKGYLALILRYGRIWTTVSGDAMVCVFVLGVCSWLRAV